MVAQTKSSDFPTKSSLQELARQKLNRLLVEFDNAISLLSQTGTGLGNPLGVLRRERDITRFAKEALDWLPKVDGNFAGQVQPEDGENISRIERGLRLAADMTTVPIIINLRGNTLYFQRNARISDISTGREEVIALNYLNSHPNATIGDLASFLALHPNQASSILEGLRKKRLIGFPKESRNGLTKTGKEYIEWLSRISGTQRAMSQENEYRVEPSKPQNMSGNSTYRGDSPIRPSTNEKYVSIGTTVKVLVDGETVIYTVVRGSDADVDKGELSKYSPLGKVLLGRKSGDEFHLTTSEGRVPYRILEIYRKSN